MNLLTPPCRNLKIRPSLQVEQQELRAVPALNPDIVMVNFTHTARREYITAAGEWMTYSRGRNPTDPFADKPEIGQQLKQALRAA